MRRLIDPEARKWRLIFIPAEKDAALTAGRSLFLEPFLVRRQSS
jgi:hypothetical protein